jgi:hypothetical protein
MAVIIVVFALLAAGAVTRAAADEGPVVPADETSVQAAAASSGDTVPAFKPPTFADDTLMYVLGPSYRNPFTTSPSQPDGADISRNTVELKHLDAWKYGHNVVEIVIKKSNDVEPAAGGGTGALGLYAIFRSGIGINRVAGRPIVAKGPLREVDIQAGMNLETKNSDFAPQERTLYFGPNLQFRFGSGFLNLGLHLRKEWNHNGHLGLNESYDLDFNVEPVWHFPFRIGGAGLAFDGFADYNTPKGRDAAGRDTRAELLARPLLKIDVSPVIGLKSQVLELGVGFDYWHNMFGKDADRVPGASQFTPVFTLAVHLPPSGPRGTEGGRDELAHTCSRLDHPGRAGAHLGPARPSRLGARRRASRRLTGRSPDPRRAGPDGRQRRAVPGRRHGERAHAPLARRIHGGEARGRDRHLHRLLGPVNADGPAIHRGAAHDLGDRPGSRRKGAQALPGGWCRRSRGGRRW